MKTSAPPAIATAPAPRVPPLPGGPPPGHGPATNPGPDSLHDIVAPRPIASVWDWLIPVIVGLAVLGLAYLAWWWWRRRQRRLSEPPPPPPPLPPHERAQRALEAATRLLGDPNAFCTEVSSILRTYLEERFGWNAPDRTTEEFLSQLRRDHTLPPSLQQLLHEFLERCDLVKFARHEPTETELLELQGAALRLVADTVPPPPPPPGVPPPPGFVPPPEAPRS